jgi:hypothetical protein
MRAFELFAQAVLEPQSSLSPLLSIAGFSHLGLLFSLLTYKMGIVLPPFFFHLWYWGF